MHEKKINDFQLFIFHHQTYKSTFIHIYNAVVHTSHVYLEYYYFVAYEIIFWYKLRNISFLFHPLNYIFSFIEYAVCTFHCVPAAWRYSASNRLSKSISNLFWFASFDSVWFIRNYERINGLWNHKMISMNNNNKSRQHLEQIIRTHSPTCMHTFSFESNAMQNALIAFNWKKS